MASHDRGGVLELLEMGARAREGDRSGRSVTWGLFGTMMSSTRCAQKVES